MGEDGRAVASQMLVEPAAWAGLGHASVATRQCRYGHTRQPQYGFEGPFYCSAHSTKANNGIPIVTTFSSVSGALMEQFDIRVRVSLLPDELYRFLAQFDQHLN